MSEPPTDPAPEPSVSEPPPASPAPELSAAPRPLGLTSRVLVGVLVVLASALAAVVECFLVPLRLGQTLVPISLVLVVGLTPFLCQLARVGIDSRYALVLPLGVWLGVVGFLAAPRPDGDVILPAGNWVATALLIGGVLMFVLSIAGQLAEPGVGRRLLSRVRRRSVD